MGGGYSLGHRCGPHFPLLPIGKIEKSGPEKEERMGGGYFPPQVRTPLQDLEEG